MLRGLCRALGRLETQALLFVGFLSLYLWPLVSTAGHGRPAFLFAYYYTCFGLNILVVTLVALCSGEQPPPDEQEEPERD